MSTRLGIISDIHAISTPLMEALSIFEQQNVDQVLCAGDIAGYGNELAQTVDLLIKHNCLSILGNHEIWYMQENSDADVSCQYFRSLSLTLERSIENKTIYMVHAQPPDAYMGGIRLIDQAGKIDGSLLEQWENELENFNHDVLIVGHTHQVFAELLAGTLVINPGSTAYNHSCAILNLPELTVKFYSLSGKPIKKTWNWGEQFKN